MRAQIGMAVRAACMAIGAAGAPLRAGTALAQAAPSVSAQEQPQKVERGYPLDMDGMIRMHNYNGSVTITGWDRDSVAMTGTIAGGKPPFGGGGRRGIKLGVEGSDAASSPLADLTVFVPMRARLSIRGAATTIDVRNFSGTLDVSTLGGRIRIGGSPTEVLAETMDGDLDVEASPTSLRAKTATGRLTWSGSSDDVTLSTVSGTIAVTTGAVGSGRMESISGDIKFTGTVKADGRVALDTHAGDVTVALGPKARVRVSVDAPRATLLASNYVRAPGTGPATLVVPRGGGEGQRAELSVRTFKGRVTVTQP